MGKTFPGEVNFIRRILGLNQNQKVNGPANILTPCPFEIGHQGDLKGMDREAAGHLIPERPAVPAHHDMRQGGQGRCGTPSRDSTGCFHAQ